MDYYKNLISEKVVEILKDAFTKTESQSKPGTTTDEHRFDTRDYNQLMGNRLATSIGLSFLAYVCLVMGCVGSALLRIKRKSDPDVTIEVISAGAAKKSPIIASLFLFGLFVISKFVSIAFIIQLLTVYVIVYTMCASYVVIEETLMYLLRISLDVMQVNFAVKNLTKKVKYFQLRLKFNYLTLLSLPLCMAVCVWYIKSDKNWMANNTIAMLIAIYAIATVHLQKLSHGVMLLGGLLVYDIFWVFGSNVMVSVATQLDVPVKLLFPNDFITNGVYSKSMSLLGLGDVVLPGLYLAFLLRYDFHAFPNRKPAFFLTGLVFYGLGMVVTTVVLYFFKTGQPALLYLVPAVFLGTLCARILFGSASNDITNYDESTLDDIQQKKIE